MKRLLALGKKESECLCETLWCSIQTLEEEASKDVIQGTGKEST